MRAPKFADRCLIWDSFRDRSLSKPHFAVFAVFGVKFHRTIDYREHRRNAKLDQSGREGVT